MRDVGEGVSILLGVAAGIVVVRWRRIVISAQSSGRSRTVMRAQAEGPRSLVHGYSSRIRRPPETHDPAEEVCWFLVRGPGLSEELRGG